MITLINILIIWGLQIFLKSIGHYDNTCFVITAVVMTTVIAIEMYITSKEE